ncbi:MAG TPA: RdgB/HAM1 family non-canonical purine NTP pyrophosphatase [Bryobacteraceae bacterium]|nr:RdgB/HAM1 family non-canonical purine NTP pyrophosphatase [Bryobacteraceae bacterium]
MTVYCATGNPGKLREFQLAAPDFDIQRLPVSVPAPEETGATFEANAIEKATAYGSHVAGFLFADDSGLEVDALGGEPGVRSARYAGEHASDDANNALLLARLRDLGKSNENCAARFICVIALVKDGRLVKTFRGAVEGRIIDAPRGTGGFGYDPLFFCEETGCTFGEASIDRKMTVSHRARALTAMFAYLREARNTASI